MESLTKVTTKAIIEIIRTEMGEMEVETKGTTKVVTMAITMAIAMAITRTMESLEGTNSRMGIETTMGTPMEVAITKEFPKES